MIKIRIFIVLFTLCMLSACKLENMLHQVLIGSVGGSQIEVYDLSNLETPTCVTTATDSTSLSDNGIISLPKGCMSKNSMYLIVASGGVDRDPDNNAVVDVEPKPVLGKMHAIIPGDLALSSAWNVSPLTESVYQSARFYLSAQYSQSEIRKELDYRTKLILKGENVAYLDLLTWKPSAGIELLQASYKLANLKDAIYQGTNTFFSGKSLASHILAAIDTAGISSDIAIKGNYLFSTEQSQSVGVSVISLAVNPPQLVTTITQTGNNSPTAIAIEGNYAFIAAFAGGMWVVDITNPESPQVVETVATPNYARGIAVKDQFVYVATDAGLQIYDVSEPGNAQFVKALTNVGYSSKLVISGNYLYSANSFSSAGNPVGLYIVNISNPANAQKVGFFASSAWSVAVNGQYAYLETGSNGLYILDISNPGIPVLLGQEPTIWSLQSGRDIAYENGFIFVADPHLSSLRVTDVRDPTNPTVVRWLPLSTDSLGVRIKDNILYLASGSSGVQIMNPMSSPGASAYDYSYSDLGITLNMQIDGDVGYLATSKGYNWANSTLQSIDLTDMSRLNVLDTLYTSGYAYYSVLDGNWLSWQKERAFQLVDKTDPFNLTTAGTISFTNYVYNIDFSNNLIYAAAGYSGLFIYDVTDKNNPRQLSLMRPNESVEKVWGDDTLAYVTLYKSAANPANNVYTFQTIDVSNPLMPSIMGSVTLSASITDMVKYGDAIIGGVASNGFYSRLIKVNISNPSTPFVEWEIQLDDVRLNKLHLDGNTLYVAALNNKVLTFDLNQPGNINPTGFFETPFPVYGIATHDGALLVTDGDGLKVGKAVKVSVP